MRNVLDIQREQRLDRLCTLAVELWGNQAQVEQAKEEMLELLVELQKIFRGRHDPQEIVKELVDVYQCIHQLILIYGTTQFREAFDEKMNKFEEHVTKALIKRDIARNRRIRTDKNGKVVITDENGEVTGYQG